jgi:adenine C2-methylase RlmN of 23S rRNA A2503 and tRNA A37
MDMGEPLLNIENVFSAVECLKAASFFNFSGARITVSTVGIPHAMEHFSERFPDVQLALSLHTARQEIRERLMPQARTYPLDILRGTVGSGRKYFASRLKAAGLDTTLRYSLGSDIAAACGQLVTYKTGKSHGPG